MREQERERLEVLYSIERQLKAEGLALIAGVDEVGRGPIAGPVTAAACILPPTPMIELLNDSKALTALRRERVAASIRTVAIAYSVFHVGPEVIDSEGIVAALRLAMAGALDGLGSFPDAILVDGNDIGLKRGERSIVKGDSLVACISAASVLAKVERDALMVELGSQFPGYGLESNKGYGSAAHMQAIRDNGLSPVHRKSFCTRIVAESS